MNKHFLRNLKKYEEFSRRERHVQERYSKKFESYTKDLHELFFMLDERGELDEVYDKIMSANSLEELEYENIDGMDDVIIYYDSISSLKLAARGAYFYVTKSTLTSLEGAPRNIGYGSTLTSLEGAPRNIGGRQVQERYSKKFR